MKGLFLFIKNNQIIYKVSIVSILILMLISVMQINPENIKKNSVGAETVIDYTIEFRASDGKFYNMSTGTEVYSYSMGLMSMGENMGQGENPQGAVLAMYNCNITSTAEIALYINGDACIYVKDGAENIINSAYTGSNANYYGIKSSGNIQFMGEGTLTVDYDNAINSDKVFKAIYSDKSIDIMQSNVIAKGNDYGIYSGENITVSSGNIEVSALGNNGVGMSVENNLTVTGGNIISKGIGRAVKYSNLITTEDKELHTHTGVIIASTDIDCKSIEKYSNDNISSYKYMELGIICDYYLKYNSKTAELKKVLSTGTEENIGFEVVPGLKKSDTTDSYGGYTLILDGFNFTTSNNCGIELEGDTEIVLTEGTTNKISSSYDGSASEFYGIVNRGGTISITGDGTLETSCNNLDETNGSYANSKYTRAICAYNSSAGESIGKVSIKSGTVIAKANGAWGTAIYGQDSVEILGGIVKAYGGNKGDTSGICADKNVNIEKAEVDVKAATEDLLVGGIYTSLSGNGDSVTISKDATVNVDISTAADKKGGLGISSGRLVIDGSTVIIKMNGSSLAGLKTVYEKGWVAVPSGYERAMIINASKVTIGGDKCYDSSAIAAYSCNLNIESSEINIDIRNLDSVPKHDMYGISTWESYARGGNIDINKSKIAVKVYNDQGAAIYAAKNLTITRSKIDASVDWKDNNVWAMGIYVGDVLTINSGMVVAKGKTVAISMNNINKKLVLNSANGVKVISVSTDYDITDEEPYDINSWENYIYMKIGGSYEFSVDITWGNMDYIYTEGQWNASSHQYGMGTWSMTSTDSDKIVVTNNSNVPVNANITFAQASGYTATDITGTIVDTQGGSNVVSTPRNILSDNSFVAYLNLSGRLASNVEDRTVIGEVIVTISE